MNMAAVDKLDKNEIQNLAVQHESALQQLEHHRAENAASKQTIHEYHTLVANHKRESQAAQAELAQAKELLADALAENDSLKATMLEMRDHPDVKAAEKAVAAQRVSALKAELAQAEAALAK